MLDQSTICAISTSPGIGAIAVIRLSGSEAVQIADKVFQSPKKNKIISRTTGQYIAFWANCILKMKLSTKLLLLFFVNHIRLQAKILLKFLATVRFLSSKKYLEVLVENGARLALPGEFTQRAFLNGKMDLSQAEAVADVIASSNAAAHRLAINQMRGGFSKEINDLRSQLLHFTAMVELELDFAEEEVEFADRTALRQLTERIEALLRKLKNSFQLGNAIKNGIPVAIIGETNVGKSTLLNVFTKRR